MKFSIQRHHKMDIFINLEDVVFGNLLAFFFPLDNVIQDGQLQIRTLKDGFTLLTNINVIIRENNGEIDDGFPGLPDSDFFFTLSEKISILHFHPKKPNIAALDRWWTLFKISHT